MSAETRTLSQAFQEGLREEMLRDDSIFLLGTDLYDRGGHWAQCKGLGAEFGRERVRDTPISEAAMVAAGVGAALNGARPIVDLNFIDFVLGAMDEVVNQAAKARYMWGVPVPLVIRGTAGVAFGGPQHNNSLEAWFAHTPGLLVATPATPADTKGLIKSALRGEDPVVFLMHKMLTGSRGPVGGADDLVPFGQAAVVRGGRDVTVVAYSAMVPRALAAAQEAEGLGIDVEVIDLRTLAPLDIDCVVASVEKTGRLVVTGEAPQFVSVVSEIAAAVQERAFDSLVAPIARVGGCHAPIAHSPKLLEAVIPNAQTVLRAIQSTVARPTPHAPRSSAPERSAAPSGDEAAREDVGTFVSVSPSRRRSAVARAMTQSALIPQFNMTVDVDAAPLLAALGVVNEGSADRGEAQVSLTDLLLRACGMTLRAFPGLNTVWFEGTLRRYDGGDVALAVGLPDGVVSPVVRGCDATELTEIAQRRSDAVTRARAARLTADDLSGARMTLSNVGAQGPDSFVALLTPGQTSVLAVGRVREVPSMTPATAPGRRLSLTLTVDHRVLDGAEAADALAGLRDLIEAPAALLRRESRP